MLRVHGVRPVKTPGTGSMAEVRDRPFDWAVRG
jgi:hypothetical protein